MAANCLNMKVLKWMNKMKMIFFVPQISYKHIDLVSGYFSPTVHPNTQFLLSLLNFHPLFHWHNFRTYRCIKKNYYGNK